MGKQVNCEVECLDTKNLDVLEKIELCGRICYASEDKITSGSAEGLVKGVIKSGHESVIEHEGMAFEYGPDYFDKFSQLRYDIVFSDAAVFYGC